MGHLHSFCFFDSVKVSNCAIKLAMAEFEPQDDTPTVPQTLLKLINS